MEGLVLELNRMGFVVDQSHKAMGILVIRDFPIRAGRYSGKTVDVGFPAQGYPDTPPTAVHIRPILDPPSRGAVQPHCPLGKEWVYWSRRIEDWPKDRSAKRIIIWLNSVFYYE